MVATFCQPFDMLSETIIAAKNENAAGDASSRVSEIWLPDLDSNQGQFD